LNLLMRGLLPAAIFTSLSAFAIARHLGSGMEAAILATSLAFLGLAMVLERHHPYQPAWNQPQGDTTTDSLSFAVVGGLVARVLADAPWLLQCIAATLMIELGKYWAHRLHHTLPALWWLHALHHGSERLYTVNNFRVHPLEYSLKHALSWLPVMLLGAPVDVLLAYLALTQPVVMLQHANLPLRNGWLNWVFSTNELHRWHHSTERGEGDSNFGSALVLWDQVFGTFRPVGRGPARVGLYAGSPYPARRSFGGQLLSMFQPGCCKA
jgi:sterol desaturase/sphingolipid hydroxylase (fatty acid hydroxylase superfamily)